MTHEDEDIKRLLTEAVPRLTPPMDRVGALAARVRRHRQRVIGSSALAVAMAVALGVGGVQMITGDHAPPLRTAGDSGGEGRWTSCADAAPEMATAGERIGAGEVATLPRLDGFTPVAAVICELETQQRPDGGQDRVATERRADKVDALVTALRLPDEPRTEGPCTMEAVVFPWLALVDAGGRWVRPGLPVDRCGKPRPAVREALDALPLTTVATHPVAEIESAEAAAAGCSQTWKDMLSVETAGNRVRRGALPEPFPAGQQVRLCVYDVPKSAPGTGNFVHGTVLPADRRTAIEHVLKAAGPAEPCSAHASRFALLWSVTGGDPQTYVELDGCYRIVAVAYPGGPVIAQGDAALAELIDKP
ncbi:hypothetical protein [Micromonospora rubida]|uniref:hypothetical protein n=1 Tax=Micromonospora rubida TaxID=2697657 RepID=UPI0013768B55|nr:hypothetical protein [Micromonospora rubida]NBE80178.1 hypothetical protein [Micromonospora rubida]